MNDKQNEIADFILSQFKDGCVSKDDLHYKMQERYNYDVVPFYVLERLKDEGLVKEYKEYINIICTGITIISMVIAIVANLM